MGQIPSILSRWLISKSALVLKFYEIKGAFKNTVAPAAIPKMGVI